MKYLYPYECERRGLSSPNELQAAIDSNRREGRRQSFGGSLFAYSPSGAHGMLSSPKLPVTSLSLAASTNGSSITPAPKIKKGESCEGRGLAFVFPGNLDKPKSVEGVPLTLSVPGADITSQTLLFSPLSTAERHRQSGNLHSPVLCQDRQASCVARLAPVCRVRDNRVLVFSPQQGRHS